MIMAFIAKLSIKVEIKVKMGKFQYNLCING